MSRTSASSKRLSLLEKALVDGNGILRCEPAWVARDFLPPGRRLGLPEDQYDVGERGFICERWLASTTRADNRVGPPDEGLSYLQFQDGSRMSLQEACEIGGHLLLGEVYARTHGNRLGRLAKIYDFNDRIPYHYHQMKKDAALVGRNSKEEAYFFPEGVPLGPHPETFFGVHPWIVESRKYDVLLPYLVDWNSDLILQHAWAELLVPGDGFHIPSGILHGPGTALTIELQEDSDVFAMLQAKVAGRIIPKDLLFKDVRKQDRKRFGERIILKQINWKLSGDRSFYEHRHLGQRLVKETRQKGGEEYWIYYNTTAFSGKRLLVRPGAKFRSIDQGVYSVLVWKGTGTFDGLRVRAGDFSSDELVVTHRRAVLPLEIVNDGKETLEIIKFFGPDINPNCPRIIGD
ncbi:MAG: hypothetical protein HYU36_12990 [Planctomycetes bacterium]|nr:hypothetical protein [Planctomycetota bacterium]